MLMKASIAAGWSYLLHKAIDYEESQSEDGSEPSDECSGSPSKKRKLQNNIEGGKDTSEEYMRFQDGTKLVICMVGKPARKTRIAGKISRYLSWLGYKVKLIKVSVYRYKHVGPVTEEFFNRKNTYYDNIKQNYREAALNDAISWLKTDGQIVIYDSANSTVAQRQVIIDRLQKEFGEPQTFAHYNSSYSPRKPSLTYRLLWIESFCEKQNIVKANFLLSDRKLRLDYQTLTDEEALDMFWKKVSYFDHKYESLEAEDNSHLEEEELSKYRAFIKITDFGTRLLTQHIQGHLETRLATYCTNLHTQPRAIILATHGESEFNVQGRIGGDPGLTDKGKRFSKNLAKFVGEQRETNFGLPVSDMTRKRDLYVWTSTSQRTIQTVKEVDGKLTSWISLAEMDAGTFESMSLAEFMETLEYKQREENKLLWRFPHGESYIDVKKRLQNVIFELERQKNDVLIVSHRPVLRCLYSYFIDVQDDYIPKIPFPLHTVVVLTPSLIGWDERRENLKPLSDEQLRNRPWVQ